MPTQMGWFFANVVADAVDLNHYVNTSKYHKPRQSALDVKLRRSCLNHKVAKVYPAPHIASKYLGSIHFNWFSAFLLS